MSEGAARLGLSRCDARRSIGGGSTGCGRGESARRSPGSSCASSAAANAAAAASDALRAAVGSDAWLDGGGGAVGEGSVSARG